jgi:hypothetical protein
LQLLIKSNENNKSVLSELTKRKDNIKFLNTKFDRYEHIPNDNIDGINKRNIKYNTLMCNLKSEENNKYLCEYNIMNNNIIFDFVDIYLIKTIDQLLEILEKI